MDLNTLKPAIGSKHSRKRVCRGIGSGMGKTGGRGHKGQRARSGGFHKVGFEGGQMPLQRRLPKRGFKSPVRDDTAEVRLSDLDRIKTEKIDLAGLKAAGIVPELAKSAKVILTGKLARKIVLTGIAVSKGARAAIEAAGGSTDAPIPQPKPKREPKVSAAPQPAGGSAAKPAADPGAGSSDADRNSARSEAKARGDTKGKGEGRKPSASQSKPEGKKSK